MNYSVLTQFYGVVVAYCIEELSHFMLGGSYGYKKSSQLIENGLKLKVDIKYVSVIK